ncbi:hypothetical protein PGSY75_1241500 [Plasmodium gaboni]|uniref:Uncharacterized protein n=1 Tax=Plasmodium gaboni TaxID=647221 RepID=A0A151LH69_9APIC|nr:hypothetical protein PGSY75_1241500 [Plasmodium gaboni]KYN98199.1 hypothetical protein PGSY75_1241500 [Plasmodium gaboni]SOV16654.1 conserved Plasmodium protein, unknown function [Plasmodium gaboni]
MNKKLEKGFSFIRNFAEKYKNVIFQGFKKRTVKTINKKNRKKKKQNVTNIVDLKVENPFINEEKKRKLDSFLMDQENELDLQENYTLFNKYNMTSDNLFFNSKNDNIYNNYNNTSGTFLKSLNIENKNGDLNDDKIKINYLDSLNSLELKIKQEIKQNNELLSKQKMMELNEYHYKTHNNGKKSGVRVKRTNSHLNKDSNRIYKRRKNNDNESQIDNVSTKSKNKKRKKAYPHKEKSYSNNSKNINNNSNMDSKQIKGTCLIQHNDKMIKTNLSDNKNSKINTENILLKNNELVQENVENNLVFGKDIYENMNDMFHKVFEVNQEHNKNEITKTSINNLMDKENINMSRNINVNNIDNNHINDNHNDNESNIKEVKSNTDQKDLDLFHKNLNNNGTPFKEDNTFDIFFNEPLETPSIFQM